MLTILLVWVVIVPEDAVEQQDPTTSVFVPRAGVTGGIHRWHYLGRAILLFTFCEIADLLLRRGDNEAITEARKQHHPYFQPRRPIRWSFLQPYFLEVSSSMLESCSAS